MLFQSIMGVHTYTHTGAGIHLNESDDELLAHTLPEAASPRGQVHTTALTQPLPGRGAEGDSDDDLLDADATATSSPLRPKKSKRRTFKRQQSMFSIV